MQSYGHSKFYIVEKKYFFYIFRSGDLDLDPMTFIYEPDPYSLEIYWMRKNKLPMSRLSEVIV